MVNQTNEVVQQPAQVEFHGDKIILPIGMSFETAFESLIAAQAHEQELIEVRERIDGAYWDAVHATYKAMTEKFNWVFQKPTMTMFGPIRPQLVSIPIGLDEAGNKLLIKLPQGKFSLPGVEGTIETASEHDPATGLHHFVIKGTVQRRFEPTVKDIAERARRIVKDNSIYLGKPLRIQFMDPNGEIIALPKPEFVDVREYNDDKIMLNDEIRAAVETSIFTPIIHTEEVREAGIPLKRGVLLAGMYGTGKTMTAGRTSYLAQLYGWTFIYCQKTEEIEQAVRFGLNYQPAVIFCEDIDREMSGERTQEMDHILNIIDGIESKGTELMLILTTNHVETLNKALLRPGRLDAVIEFLPPNAKTVMNLMLQYGSGRLDPEVDLEPAAKILEGQIPAVIRECVERAKLSQIKFGDRFITTAALVDAATSMGMQIRMLNGVKNEPTKQEVMFASLQNMVKTAVENIVDFDDIDRIEQKVDKVLSKF